MEKASQPPSQEEVVPSWAGGVACSLLLLALCHQYRLEERLSGSLAHLLPASHLYALPARASSGVFELQPYILHLDETFSTIITLQELLSTDHVHIWAFFHHRPTREAYFDETFFPSL